MDDWMLDYDMDLYAENGDFVVGDSLEQDVIKNLNARKGDFKQSPLIGANVMQYLDGVIDTAAKRDIKLALQADNLDVKKVDYENDNLKVDAVDS